MSVITGLWLKDGEKVVPETLDLIGERSKRYAPDGTTSWRKDSLGMMFQAFHTHERSFSDKGIASDDHGNVVALDGRIDNCAELCHELDLSPQITTDSVLVLAGYRRWGNDLLGRLVGDWSLSLWDAVKKTLLLARDHAGTRTLYYSDTPTFTMWSTYPEPLLAYLGVQSLDHEYVRRYLAAAPTGDLTPYAGIKAVPAACYLLIRQTGEIRCVEHWSPLVKGKLCYQRDQDYQEEFLSLFCQAVKRRTDGAGVFAHLSGGVDSSSIVCVADLVAARSGTPLSLQTMSFFDDQEPDWDERPFFTAIEEHRGIRGSHLHVSAAVRDFVPPPVFYPFPGMDNASYERERRSFDLPTLEGCRAIIAGHGGDELLGGPPDSRPELADALTAMSLGSFFRSSFEWAISKRMPLIFVVAEAVRFTISCYPGIPAPKTIYPSWLLNRVKRVWAPSVSRLDFSTIGFSPSAVGAAADWQRLLGTLPHQIHGHFIRHEYRYPFLDRDLVDFLLRVPSNQLLRPGRRRFMMRAALRGIVPDAVLERKRKGFVSRGPHMAVQTNAARMIELLGSSTLAQVGFIDAAETTRMLKRSPERWDDQITPLLRLIELEIWICQALGHRVIEYLEPVAA